MQLKARCHFDQVQLSSGYQANIQCNVSIKCCGFCRAVLVKAIVVSPVQYISLQPQCPVTGCDPFTAELHRKKAAAERNDPEYLS